MTTLRELYTSGAGLMSAGAIIFMIGMGVFLFRFARRHMTEDALRAKPRN